MTTFPATIIVTLTKAEPLTFIRLSGMFVAVAGTAAGAAARAILVLFSIVTPHSGAVVTAIASNDGSARGTQLILGLCVLVAQVFAAAAIMIVCKKVTP